MKVLFGNGKASIGVAAHGNTSGHNSSSLLIIEQGIGCGIVGGGVASRKKGMEINLGELESSETDIVFEFLNAESVSVMIEQLLIIKKDLEK